MSQRPFVSVLTPTYNRRKFLPAMIECYKAQTYPAKNMEWIILDDGTDCVKDVFDTLGKDIPNLRYIRLEEKKLIGAKRNILNAEAKGDIMVAMDDDDYYHVDRVHHVVQKFQQNPKIDLAGSSELYMFYTAITQRHTNRQRCTHNSFFYRQCTEPVYTKKRFLCFL
jgi:glycosyltransferase involved in cell wall biosynthesis